MHIKVNHEIQPLIPNWDIPQIVVSKQNKDLFVITTGKSSAGLFAGFSLQSHTVNDFDKQDFIIFQGELTLSNDKNSKEVS